MFGRGEKLENCAFNRGKLPSTGLNYGAKCSLTASGVDYGVCAQDGIQIRQLDRAECGCFHQHFRVVLVPRLCYRFGGLSGWVSQGFPWFGDSSGTRVELSFRF